MSYRNRVILYVETALLSQTPVAPEINTLSDREFEVMSLIADGKTIVEIAREKKLSLKTISTYRTRLLKKLRLRTKAEITHYVDYLDIAYCLSRAELSAAELATRCDGRDRGMRRAGHGSAAGLSLSQA